MLFSSVVVQYITLRPAPAPKILRLDSEQCNAGQNNSLVGCWTNKRDNVTPKLTVVGEYFGDGEVDESKLMVGSEKVNVTNWNETHIIGELPANIGSQQ